VDLNQQEEHACNTAAAAAAAAAAIARGTSRMLWFFTKYSTETWFYKNELYLFRKLKR
jgi:hypothetical protein